MKHAIEQQAKEFAEKCHDANMRAGFFYRYDDLDMINAFKEGVNWQANQSPWISIEDRMPEDEQLVLTSSSIYGIKLLVWNDHYNVWDDEDGDDVYCERDKIDTWMPIPE